MTTERAGGPKYRQALILLLGFLLLRCSPAAAGQVNMPPDSWEGIRGFLDFSEEDMTEAEILLNAPHYAYVFGSLPWQLDTFRAANPDINLGRYSVGLYDEYDSRPDLYRGEKQGDTPERRARTLQWWMGEVDGTGHPDWILYRCDGVTLAYWTSDDGTTLPNMPLDFSNPEVADWQLRNLEPATFSSHFFDLVYLDNGQRGCGIWRDGQWVQLFTGRPGDPAYTEAVLAWANRISRGLHARPTPQGFVPNCPMWPSYPDEAISAMLDIVDGWHDEEGFTAYGTYRYSMSEDRWLHKIQSMIAVQERGLPFYSMNYVSTLPPPDDEMQWVLASYLMGKEHSAYVLMTVTPDERRYLGRWPHLPQYDSEIGHPCSPMALSQGVYVRDYSKGMAVVNPSWDTGHEFQLPADNFTDVNGVPVDSVLTLPPVTGKVLLSSEQRCP